MSDEVPPFEEWFCSSCRTLLMRVVPAPGMHISIRCKRCGAIIERKIEHSPHNGVVGPMSDVDMRHLIHRIDDYLRSVTEDA